MFDVSKINNLYGLVGFRTSTESDYGILDADNEGSTSGLYVQDVCPLISIRNIKNTIQDRSISDADFNTLLKNWQKSAIQDLCNEILIDYDFFIENRVLFNYESKFEDKITNGTKFVGFEINPVKRKDIGIIINTIFLRFDGEATFNIYLFHSSQKEPILTKEVTTETNNEVSVSVSDFILRYADYPGGKYYIGYLLSDIGAVQAIARDYNLSDVQTNYNMFSIRAIKVEDHNTNTLFNVEDVEYTSENWGLNFDISSIYDYTDVIVENKDRMAVAVQYLVAEKALKQIAYSQRENRDKRLSQSAYLELKGNAQTEEMPFNLGLEKRTRNEIKKLKKTLFKEQKIQKLCIK